MVRVAKRFPKERIGKMREEHTPAGHHVAREIAFPKWVPVEVMEKAKGMGEEEALAALGPWALPPKPSLKKARGKRRDPLAGR